MKANVRLVLPNISVSNPGCKDLARMAHRPWASVTVEYLLPPATTVTLRKASGWPLNDVTVPERSAAGSNGADLKAKVPKLRS